MNPRPALTVLVVLTMLANSGCGKSSRDESVRFAKLGLDIPVTYFEAQSSPISPSPEDDYAVITAIFPDMRPAKSSEWRDPNNVFIVFRRVVRMTRTEDLISNYEKLKGSTTPARPILVASSATERRFNVKFGRAPDEISTYVVRNLPDGSLLSIEDPGTWSSKSVCNRRVGDVEVNYHFEKTGGPDAESLDAAVVSLMKRLVFTSASKL